MVAEFYNKMSENILDLQAPRCPLHLLPNIKRREKKRGEEGREPDGSS